MIHSPLFNEAILNFKWVESNAKFLETQRRIHRLRTRQNIGAYDQRPINFNADMSNEPV